MTVREKIQKYLAKCKSPKSLAQIVAGAKVNGNSARRELANMYGVVLMVGGYSMAEWRKVELRKAA